MEIMSYYLKNPLGKPVSKLFAKTSLNIEEKVRNLLPSETRIENSFSISAFCLMPNHFHLLIKQNKAPTNETSVSNFMRRLCITYAMYFGKKYENHSGNIFQGRYKNILVDNDSQLIYLTKYIHLNPSEISESSSIRLYPYSSYSHYLKKRRIDWVNASEILKYFSDKNPNLNYSAFVEDNKQLPEFMNTLSLEAG